MLSSRGSIALTWLAVEEASESNIPLLVTERCRPAASNNAAMICLLSTGARLLLNTLLCRIFFIHPNNVIEIVIIPSMHVRKLRLE